MGRAITIATPLRAWTSREGSRKLRFQDFKDNRHKKVVNLSALHNDRLYYPVNVPGTDFYWDSVVVKAPGIDSKR